MSIGPWQELSGRILTPKGWQDGVVRFDEHIDAVDVIAPDPEPGTDHYTGPYTGHYIVPGFIDLHVPGGGGGDTMTGVDAVRTLARAHARCGTTSLTPAPVTAPAADMLAAAAAIDVVAKGPADGEASILGAHIEGPFLNAERLGAQPPFAIAPDSGLAQEFLSATNVKIMTLAPELSGALPLIEMLAAAGVAAQVGHSAATYDETVAALDAGALGFTHLYNAMSALHHRDPGVVGAALARAHHAALIPDLLHVAPGAIAAALRAIPGLHFVTDAVAAATMPDGGYTLGPTDVTKQGDGVYLTSSINSAHPVLAGSALTMDRALTNLLSIGLGLADAVERLSTVPAEYLGLTDRGVIDVRRRADLVVLNGAAAVIDVWIGGRRVDRRGYD